MLSDAEFLRLLEQQRPQATRHAWRYLANRDEVEDAVQDAILQAYRYRSTYRPERGALHSWFIAVVSSVCCERLERRRKEKLHYKTYEEVTAQHLSEAASANDPYLLIEQQQAQSEIRDVFSEMPEQEQELLLLIYVEDQPAAMIAEGCGVNRTAIWQRAYRARNRLRRKLQEQACEQSTD